MVRDQLNNHSERMDDRQSFKHLGIESLKALARYLKPLIIELEDQALTLKKEYSYQAIRMGQALQLALVYLKYSEKFHQNLPNLQDSEDLKQEHRAFEAHVVEIQYFLQTLQNLETITE